MWSEVLCHGTSFQGNFGEKSSPKKDSFSSTAGHHRTFHDSFDAVFGVSFKTKQ